MTADLDILSEIGSQNDEEKDSINSHESDYKRKQKREQRLFYDNKDGDPYKDN